MCPLVKEFQKHAEDFKTVVCVTGQHREMLDQVLQIFDVVPYYDLNIMKQGQDLYDIMSRGLLCMRDMLKLVQPDVVMVHGSTILNPNVRKPIHEVFGEDLSKLNNMFFIEPLEYLSFVFLM
jgi:UDP-N-acetylglucosamine 2-epimerase